MYFSPKVASTSYAPCATSKGSSSAVDDGVHRLRRQRVHAVVDQAGHRFGARHVPGSGEVVERSDEQRVSLRRLPGGETFCDALQLGQVRGPLGHCALGEPATDGPSALHLDGQHAERQLDLPMDDDCTAPSMRLGDLA